MKRAKQWRATSTVCLVLILLAVSQLGGAAYIHAKAQLAQYLIANAWQRSLASGGEPRKPWPWADTWPVARLQATAQSIDLYVLAGDSGNVLAFGPGMLQAGARPGGEGTAIIAAHRDTHFAFLEQLPKGATLQLQGLDGHRFDYVVDALKVVDSRSESMKLSHSGRPQLQLITCYPFSSFNPNGPLRYVVTAQSAEAATAEFSF